MGKTTYRGYTITRKWRSTGDHAQPDEFTFIHPDYDGPPNPNCGFGTTNKECRNWIDELLMPKTIEDLALLAQQDAVVADWLRNAIDIALGKNGYDAETVTPVIAANLVRDIETDHDAHMHLKDLLTDVWVEWQAIEIDEWTAGALERELCRINK